MFRPARVVAEMEPVVAPDNDSGAVGQFQFFQCLENSSQLRVDETDTGIVGMDHVLLFCFRSPFVRFRSLFFIVLSCLMFLS
jgi:hypothetical protein